MSMDAARLLDHRSEADLKAELEPLRRRVEQLQWGALRQFQSKKKKQDFLTSESETLLLKLFKSSFKSSVKLLKFHLERKRSTRLA